MGYNPDQPRDDRGRWGSGGGSSGEHGRGAPKTAPLRGSKMAPLNVTMDAPTRNVKAGVEKEFSRVFGEKAKATFSEEQINVKVAGAEYQANVMGDDESISFTLVSGGQHAARDRNRSSGPPPIRRGGRYF